MKESQHLNKIGLTTIIKKAYQMNSTGKKKYTEDYLLKIIEKI